MIDVAVASLFLVVPVALAWILQPERALAAFMRRDS